ncbi:MAG TPA: hypothetical protein VHE34_13580 [Puia sp.]|uniref:hypothetical protein n=1 Tax=Puia sp. TaxID=2045100 RepID=UPI002BA6088C|nr:hypothetical protein [Puia sp.]HVU96254.1 hypothetical protein [Puia sp.]
MRPTRICSLSLIASAFALVLASSCKKNNNNGGGDNISATVGATNVSGAHTQAAYSTYLDMFLIASYNVQGKDTTGFFLTIPNAKVGKAISSDTTFLEMDYVGSNGADYAAYSQNGHVTLTINTLDSVGHKISGTFSGTAYASANDSVLITNGKFSSSYTKQ